MTPGTPCDYAVTLTQLTETGTLTSTVSSGTDAGAISSTTIGGLGPFDIPTNIGLTSTTNAAQFSGAISLNDIGSELLAMQTVASTNGNLNPGILVGVVPVQGDSAASLTGITYVMVGIGTNPTSGVAGDLGVLEGMTFDGQGGFSSAETTNTWNANTQTGGANVPSPGVATCPNGATPVAPVTGLVCGTYTVAANGNVSLTFATGQAGGINAGYTFTGAFSSDLMVLTNVGTIGPRFLMLGIAQPSTTAELSGCESNPLNGVGLASEVDISLGMTYNSSVVETVTFNNGAGTLTLGGGTLNNGGVLSTYGSGDTATYTVSGGCFYTVPHQTDSLGNQFDFSEGEVSPTGAVWISTDMDDQGGGPAISIGVRIENLIQLN